MPGCLIPFDKIVNTGHQRIFIARQEQINLILDMPDVQQSLVSAGFEVIKGRPEDFAAMINNENVRWKNVVQLNSKSK